MRSMIYVYLFGSLRNRLGDLCDLPIKLELKAPTPLVEVLEGLGIAPDMVQLSMANHRAIPKDSAIHPGDRLSLFPKEYPIFADWMDLRSSG